MIAPLTLRAEAGEVVSAKLSRLGLALMVGVWAYALFFSLVIVGNLGESTRLFEEAGYIPLAIAASFGALVASRRNGLRLRDQRAWRLIAVSWACVVLGEIGYAAFPGVRLYGMGLQDIFDGLLSRVLALGGFVLLIAPPRGRYAYTKLFVEVTLVLVVTAALAWYYQSEAGIAGLHLSNGVLVSPDVAATLFEMLILVAIAVVLHRPAELGGGAALQLLAVSKFATTVAVLLYEHWRLTDWVPSRQAAGIAWAISAAGFAAGGLLFACFDRTSSAKREWPRDLRVLPYMSMATIGLVLLEEAAEPVVNGDILGPLAIVVLMGTTLIVMRMIVAGGQLTALAHDRAAQSKRLNTLVRRSTEALLVVDARGLLTFASPAAEMLLAASNEAIIGQPLADFAPESERLAVERVWREPSDGTIVSWHAGRGVDRRDVESQVTDLRTDATVGGIVLHCRDVTQLRRQEREQRQTQKLEAVGLLAGGIAHDFNNLLTVIQANAELLKTDHATLGGMELDEIARASDRGAALCRQLLSFSRSDAPEREPQDVAVLVSDLEPMLRRVLPKSVQLVVRGEPGEVRAHVDTVQLDVVLMNLVNNSRDAMPQGGVIGVESSRLQVQAGDPWHQRAVPPGEYACLVVSDDGEGMSDEAMAHAFEPFFTTKPIGYGTGLGLATVHGVVTSHDGYVRIDSVRGRGTMVTVLLPFDGKLRPQSRTSTPSSNTSTGRGRILVVEDEEAIRALLTRYLSRAGYEVLEASDGVAALALLETEGWKVDLVLSDMMMPKMNGGTLARRVRAERPDIPVVVMSGYAREDGGSTQAAPPPDVAHIAKPFALGDLGKVVRETLDKKTGAT